MFIDEIHRINKSQQDALLPAVEKVLIILIGATTENPYFTVNAPLLSRSRVFPFEPLSEENIVALLTRALKAPQAKLHDVEISKDALQHLARSANGDARGALNALELAAALAKKDVSGKKTIDIKTAEEAVQQRYIVYDRDGDSHYDVISAFIKSVRGSAPDEALFWLARMLEAGEDPLFIARRLVILAAEDIGNADPHTACGCISRPGRADDCAGRQNPSGPGDIISGYGAEKQCRLCGNRQGTCRTEENTGGKGACPFARYRLQRCKRFGTRKRLSLSARLSGTFCRAKLFPYRDKAA